MKQRWDINRRLVPALIQLDEQFVEYIIEIITVEAILGNRWN